MVSKNVFVFAYSWERCVENLFFFPLCALHNPPYTLTDSTLVHLRTFNHYQNSIFNFLTQMGEKWKIPNSFFFIYHTESSSKFLQFIYCQALTKNVQYWTSIQFLDDGANAHTLIERALKTLKSGPIYIPLPSITLRLEIFKEYQKLRSRFRRRN